MKNLLIIGVVIICGLISCQQTPKNEIIGDKDNTALYFEFFARQKKGYEAEQVIFVVGMPRTGTTLLEQIITTYDGIETAGELHHFSRLLNDACHEFAPDSGVDNIYEPIDRVDFEKLGRDYVDGARLHVPDSHRFIDKYPLNFLMVGAILTALPILEFL